MRVNILERLMLSGILPQEGNFITLKTVRETREKLSPTPKESKDWKFTYDEKTQKYSWSNETDTHTEIEFNEQAIEIIKKALIKMDNDEKLTEQYYSIYEKFINGDN